MSLLWNSSLFTACDPGEDDSHSQQVESSDKPKVGKRNRTLSEGEQPDVAASSDRVEKPKAKCPKSVAPAGGDKDVGMFDAPAELDREEQLRITAATLKKAQEVYARILQGSILDTDAESLKSLAAEVSSRSTDP